MKVAAILMPWYRRESPAPEFAMMIALLKKQGHTVIVHDINNAIFQNEFFLRKYWKYFLLNASAEIEEEFFSKNRQLFEAYSAGILSANPEVIVFKVIGNTYANSIEMAGVLKEKDKDLTIIFSGALVPSREDVESFVSSQGKFPFDYIICGEDEIALSALIKGLEMNSPLSLNCKGKVIDCWDGPRLEDLDALPFHDFSDFSLHCYKVPERLEMFISKGCPWCCSFCSDWLTERKYRSMSGRRIYAEVQHQMELYPQTKYIRFCDKTINGNPDVLDDFCNCLLEKYQNIDRDNLPFTWSGDAMIRQEMTKELLLKMRQAGCTGLGYGLESGSDKVIRDMHKLFSVSLAEMVIKDTYSSDITTSINIMVGFPTETQADFQETVRFIERNRQYIDEIRLTFQGCRIAKYSTLYNYPERFNLANVDMDTWLTKDGLNTQEERNRRYEVICQRILDLGIELRVNSRLTKKVVKQTENL